MSSTSAYPIKSKSHSYQRFCIFIALISLVFFVVIGAADARTSVNSLESGDIVFINEENLDVSAIIGDKYTELRTKDGLHTIPVIDGRINVGSGIYGGSYPFYFYGYDANTEMYGKEYIIVSDLSSLLSGIYIKMNVSSGSTEMNAENTEIINTDEIQYFVKINQAYVNPFNKFMADFERFEMGRWYEFGYEPDGLGYYKLEVINIDGQSQKITGTDPTNPSNSARFIYYMNNMKTGSHALLVHFKLDLDTILRDENQPEFRINHIVRESGKDDFSVSASSTNVDVGTDNLMITMHGRPREKYDITIEPRLNMTFPPGISSPNGKIERIDAHHIVIIFGESGGDIVHPVLVDENTQKGDYHVYMEDTKGNVRSVKITVNAVSRVPQISIPNDLREGKFASGDSFRFTVKYEHPKTGETVSVSLRDGLGGEKVIAQDLSFVSKQEYTFVVSTRGFDAGTYTLIVRTSGGETVRESFYLGDPTLTVNSGIPQSRVIDTDKDLDISYSVRGSPDNLTWYLFGTNLRKSGNITVIPEGTTDEDNAHIRTGKMTFFKEDIEKYDDGVYYFIVEHPGSDNNFTLSPVMDAEGNIEYIVTQTGSIISVANRQAANAAAAVIDNLKNSQSDDLFVQESFSIQKSGFLLISDIKNMQLQGNSSFSISGITSAPAGKIVNLQITPVSFAPHDVSNTAMQMKAGYSATLTENDDKSARIFTVSGIDTSGWIPGTYVAEFTIDNPPFTESVSFVLGTNGLISSSDVAVSGPTMETVPTSVIPTSSPLPTITPTSIPTDTISPVQTTVKSFAPGMGLLMGMGIAGILLVKRKRV